MAAILYLGWFTGIASRDASCVASRSTLRHVASRMTSQLTSNVSDAGYVDVASPLAHVSRRCVRIGDATSECVRTETEGHVSDDVKRRHR